VADVGDQRIPGPIGAGICWPLGPDGDEPAPLAERSEVPRDVTDLGCRGRCDREGILEDSDKPVTSI